MKTALKLGILFILGICAGYAQNTIVTATITDPDGQTWNNGTWTAVLINSVISGTQSGVMNGSGTFTATLTDNSTVIPSGNLPSQWRFTLCPNASSACSIVSKAVSGASENISSALSAGVQAPRFPATPLSYGYLDGEVDLTPVPGGTYYNVTNLITRLWNGTTWVNSGGGGGGSGTVTSVGVATANGISATGGPITTSGNFTFSLGAITPASLLLNTASNSGLTVENTNTANVWTYAEDNTGDLAIAISGYGNVFQFDNGGIVQSLLPLQATDGFSVTGTSTLGVTTGTSFNGVVLTTADAATTYLNGAGAYTTPAGGMVYPGAGVANSTGTAWGTSYTVGNSGSDIPQLSSGLLAPAILPLASSSAFGAVECGSGTTCTGGVISASGAVASVSNSDGTLTITPTTGAVVASLNLAQANTWTAPITVNATGTPSQFNLTPSGTSPATVTGAASVGVPNTVTTPGVYLLPAAPATGIWHATNASGIVTDTLSAVSLTADVTGALPNANLANPSTTVNSQTCTLGSTCTVPGTITTFTTTGTSGAATFSGGTLNIPNYATSGGTVALTSITAGAAGTNSITSAAASYNTWLWTGSASPTGSYLTMTAPADTGTSTVPSFWVNDTASDTRTGPLWRMSTGASSTEEVFEACAGGTTNCIHMGTTAVLSAFGTASINAQSMNFNTFPASGALHSGGRLFASGVSAVTSEIASAVTTATGGSGTGTVTCLTTTCTNIRGTYSVVGGTFTTGNLLVLVWPTTTTAYDCIVSQNGGVAYYGLGHSNAVATGLTITAGISVAAVTVTADYACTP